MKVFAPILGLVISAVIILPAHAGRPDPRIAMRQRHQHARIAHGVKSGELTKTEAKDLRGDQKELRKKEQAYKADGELTKDERKDLHKDLNENSKEIYQEKHDDETRE